MPTLRREVVVSGDGNCLYRTVALWKDEISEGKHEEIPRSSDSLFENDPKVFERPLFSLNSLEDLVSKIKIRRTPAETVDLYSVVHCSLSNPFVPYHRRRMGSVLSRISTLVRSQRSQQRGNVGV